MKLPVCAVFDKKTGLFDRPVTVRHLAELIRDWDILRKDPNTKMGKNPEDFDLIQIGYFEDQSGTLEVVNPHVPIASGV